MTAQHRSVDPDAPLSQEDEHIKWLGRVIAQAAITPHVYNERNGNGKFVNWILGITATLLGLGIGGLILLELSSVQRLTAVETKLDFLMTLWAPHK